MKKTSPVFAGLIAGLRPKKKRTLANWMEAKMRLSAESSAKPGPFRFGDATYQRGIAEAVSDPNVTEIVLKTSSQVGKTTIERGMFGYYVDQEPCPILLVLPTKQVAGTFEAKFISPMIRDTACLRNAFESADGRTQQAMNRSFPGGSMSIVGANVPSDLAMIPIRVVLGDEVDRWPVSSGKEGDPVTLAWRRTETYKQFGRKGIWVSTPTIKDTSRITMMFEETDKRHFFVPCPKCGHKQKLEWGGVVYTKGRETEARYQCEAPGCEALWTEIEKRRAVREGEWIATAKGQVGKVGFHINAIYSPWTTMAEMAIEFENAQGNPEKEQAFTNTMLGLEWDGDISSFAEADALKSRREEYAKNTCPARAALICAGVDVQPDRLETSIWAYGSGDEGWLLDHVVLYGDASAPRVWQDLEELLQRQFPHPLGPLLSIEAACIDSGGANTQSVYNFASFHESLGRRWHAIKGVPGERQPIFRRSKQKFGADVKLYLVGVDDAKTTLYQRYRTPEPGSAYIHIPEHISDAICEQMTVERAVTKYEHGFPVKTWEKKRGARNEALDCAVYAMAAKESLQIDIEARLRQWLMKPASMNAAQIGALFA